MKAEDFTIHISGVRDSAKGKSSRPTVIVIPNEIEDNYQKGLAESALEKWQSKTKAAARGSSDLLTQLDGREFSGASIEALVGGINGLLTRSVKEIDPPQEFAGSKGRG